MSYGQGVFGVVRVTDVPFGDGRSYLVERELEPDGYDARKALLSDHYLLCGYPHNRYSVEPSTMPT